MKIPMQPFFLQSSQGALFSLFYPPKQPVKNKFILHIPAFAEEMNCARHVVAQQCRAFSEQGYSVLVVDLLGTGDSEGDFSEASWAIWKENIFTAYQWLVEQGAESVIFWSLRLGSLLAMDCMTSFSTMKIERLIAWQPVLNGELFISQFLRLKVAAYMIDNSQPSLKVNNLKQQLLEGQQVEIGGYLLSSDLTESISKLNAIEMDLSSVVDMTFFEIVLNKNTPGSLTNVQFIESFQGHCKIDAFKQIVGTAFWSVHGGKPPSELYSVTLQCCL